MSFNDWHKQNITGVFARRPIFKTLNACLLWHNFDDFEVEVYHAIEFWHCLRDGLRRGKIRRYGDGFVFM